MAAFRWDALVLLGATGDLAHKMIFPALYRLVKHGAIKVPVVEVAAPRRSLADFRNRVRVSLTRSVGIDNEDAFSQRMSLRSHVSGDYNDARTFPYERLLADAMAGDGALFTREDAVEAAWTVVEPILNDHHSALRYDQSTWGPKEADVLIAPDGSQYTPTPREAT